MIRYVCPDCAYTYDEESGIPPQGIPAGTSFEDLPEDWCCPECGVPKEDFRKVEL